VTEHDGWRLHVDQQPGRTVLRVGGDLDIATAPRFLREIDRHLDDEALVVDLTGVEFIDSSGLSALIRITKHRATAGGEFEIISPAPLAAKAFEITGLDQVLPLRSPA
jgi:anti-sigma B factor antagonist